MSDKEDGAIVVVGGEEMFLEEKALAELLEAGELFASSRQYVEIDGTIQKETILLLVNCNDVFAWGCADAEELPYSELESLYRSVCADPVYGSLRWCALRRKMRPQLAHEKNMREAGKWDAELDALLSAEQLAEQRKQ